MYHATYAAYLASIEKDGLRGFDVTRNWEDSKPGVVYLAHDYEVAVSHAETSDVVPDAFFDHLVVLEIDMSQLDHTLLRADDNVRGDASTLEYHGVIAPHALRVVS